MNIREKRAPQYLSIAACAASLLITGWLWSAGQKDPERYTLTMTFHHHQGYGAANVSCQECHVPESSRFFHQQRAITCLTSGCHGELYDETPEEEKLRLAAAAQFPFMDDEAMERGRLYLLQHSRAALEGMTCIECHTEHTPMTTPTLKPEWWDSVKSELSQREPGEFVSLRHAIQAAALP